MNKMIVRLILWLALVSSLIICFPGSDAFAGSAPHNQQQLRVSIGIPIDSEGQRVVSDDGNVLKFPIVIENISSAPVKIWAEWNSSGTRIITIEVTRVDGKLLPAPIVVRKGSQIFTINYPDPETIAPNEATVREVRIKMPRDANDLQNAYAPYYFNLPLPDPGGKMVLTLRAVLNIPPVYGDPLSHGVWVGKIASPEHDYVIDRSNQATTAGQP